MKPIETKYRDHTILIRDDVVTGTVGEQPVTNRIIEVDHIDITSRCRPATTDEEKTEEARRFIDRIYPKGSTASEFKGKRP